MVLFLAWRNLRRSGTRTILLVAGVAVAGALLFDMSMLAGGLEESFGTVLGRLGYEIRAVLAGTLPLSTDAVIPDAARAAARIERHPGVLWASAVLGTNLHVEASGRRTTAVALGLEPEVRGIVTVVDGAGGPGSLGGVVINRELARALGLAPGARIRLATQIDAQTGSPREVREVPVTAIGDFTFDLRAQRSLALPLGALQDLLGLRGEEASFLVVKVRPGSDAEVVAAWIDRAFPALDAFSIGGLLAEARKSLTYFNHFAAILSAVSLLVTLLLIGAVLTLAIGERLGELATLRALGLARLRALLLVVLEGTVIALVSVPLALALGAALARPLDAILAATPGVPQDVHFFVVTAGAIGRTAALLLATGALGAAYPAWVAARLNIAATLHGEVQ